MGKTYNVSLVRFILIYSVFNLFAYNIPVFKYAFNNLEFFSLHLVLVVFSMGIALLSISIFLFSIITFFLPSSLIKVFYIIISFFNSLALYFVNTYNVILDKSMMGNVFNTNSSEAFSYYDTNIFLYLFLFGFIPSFLIYKIKIEELKRLKLISLSSIIFFVSLGILYINSPTWLWFDKHAKVLGGLTMPWSYSINAIRYKQKELNKNQKTKKLPDAKFLNKDEKLVVLIIGESARSANFSLYDYEKNTNPKLKKQDIEVLKNTKSTTTYTTASIHSMLSYKGKSSDSFESLPSYLHRQGVDVLWRANNWGAPKLDISNFEKAGELKKICKDECEYDGVLLTNLKEKIESLKKNKKFVVLHTAGSHGPTYFKKYPKNFEIFKPICKSVDVASCTKEELFNAYDNSLVYTDHFINNTIEVLKQIDIPSVMIYISDHGESLGEYNLYLHGTPYSIAPDFQKDIPFLIWRSKDFKISVKKKEKYGQYNIFHTVLNALDLRSEIYDEKFNILDKKIKD